MGKNVMLSQCMIVKNEEKNIEKALLWEKNIVYEQIVVDTGSTDRTVEIAEQMGATVYHFPWIDDFSAAKNFAIEKASGDWIAFLDADEYFLKKDTLKLTELLGEIEAKKANAFKHLIVCGWIHLDDEGLPYSIGIQTRIFRNMRELRYHNRIHEQLELESGERLLSYDASDSIAIQHTGYSPTAYVKTNKLNRNIELLRKELEERPFDSRMLEYLAESLFANGQNDEAEKLFEKHLMQLKKEKLVFRQDVAFLSLLRIYIERDKPEDALKIEKLNKLFQKTNSFYPDIDFWMGIWKAKHIKWKESADYLEMALEKQKKYDGMETVYLTGSLEHAYYLLATSYQERGEIAMAVKYCTLALRSDPYSERVILPLLTMFKQDVNTSTKDIIAFLQKLYDLTLIKNKLFLFKCAKRLSFTELEDIIYNLLSAEEKSWLNEKDLLITQLSKKEWLKDYPEVKCVNKLDQDFLLFMDEIKSKDFSQLLLIIRQKLDLLENKDRISYSNFVNYFAQFDFWGKLSPQEGVFEALEGRTNVLKKHRKDFVWLYSKMSDYRSKKTFLAILKNWLYIDMSLLEAVQEKSDQYFDFDIIPSGKDEVIADLGAYTGDTFDSFIQNYGETYKRYYCYEVTPDAVEAIKRNTKKYRDVVVCQKAAGLEKKTAYFQENPFNSANKLSTDQKGQLIEMISIDEDIQEPLTFIKMDIEGAEADALKGCRSQIIENHPKLAISVYHSYDDLWKLPKMIDEIESGYNFYLRYYGGNLIPTEIVLYAI